jgi:hypothetical protein
MFVVREPLPTLIGYRVKKVMARPNWLKDARVVDICSVSDCMSSPPEGWIDRWDVNDASCYWTVEGAVATIPTSEAAAYTTFAYFMYPLEFDEGDQLTERKLTDLFGSADQNNLPQQLNAGYHVLGYDVVQGNPAQPAQDGYAPVMFSFGCSPLSCNNRSIDFEVNKHCLLNDWDEAARAAREFSNGGAEPPPYYIVRIHRAIGST